uniref:Uncharacterized protein n=1 Tax=Tetranychus urticae TaxID=32264 RepID=T1KFN3_TETUR
MSQLLKKGNQDWEKLDNTYI